MAIVNNLSIFDKSVKEKTYNIKKSREYINYSRHMRELAKEYDKIGNTLVSENLGYELESIFEEGYIIGMASSNYRDSDLNFLFTHGLEIASSDISLYFNLLNRFPFFWKQFKMANTKLILVKIPEDYIGYAINSEDAKPIYIERENKYYLLPEFIYGQIDCHKDFISSSDLIKNPNYKNKHDYDINNLVYDDNVEMKRWK